jgi:hypothetical protein
LKQGALPGGTHPITKHAPIDGFLGAAPAPPERGASRARRRNLGLMTMVIQAERPVNTAAWFALAVAAPLALLAMATTATQVGVPRAAGFWATLLLAPAIVLALRSLERKRTDATPAEAREHDLARSFCLTTGQACGLLFVVAAGARFSGESVAVGLAMAGVPLTIAVVSNVWARIFPPLGERATPVLEVSASRNWQFEWAEAERVRTPEPAPAFPHEIFVPPEFEAEPIAAAEPFPPAQSFAPVAPSQPRHGAPVTLRIQPMPMDEAWMRRGLRRDLERRQNGSGWTSGSTQVRLASAVNSTGRLQ